MKYLLSIVIVCIVARFGAARAEPPEPAEQAEPEETETAETVAAEPTSEAEKTEKPDKRGEKKQPTDRIVEIVVEDNTKTTDQTVILVSGVSRGTRFDPQMLDQIKANLVDSGLFKDVDVGYQKLPRGYRLLISAEDKHSWIIAPTYYNQPTNQGLGLGYGENNLFGENKKLLLYGQVATGDSFFIGAYIDPSIAGSRFGWQFDTYLLSERVIEYIPPSEWRDVPTEARLSRLQYLNVGVTGRVRLSRRVTADLRLRGADVSYQDAHLARDAMVGDVTDEPGATPDNIPDPGAAGLDFSAEAKLEYDSRANWYGISHGDRYRLSVEHALPWLVSDFTYWTATLEFVRARRYFTRHNFIVKGLLGFGRSLPFQREYTGGGTDLRGFKNHQYRGNTQAAMSLEYSVPVVTIKGVSLRALAFFDTSYTVFLDTDLDLDQDTFRNYLPGQRFVGGIDELDLAPWKNTVGMGIRLNIRQVVLPLLGVDFGYGIERRAAEIYLAIGLTDV